MESLVNYKMRSLKNQEAVVIKYLEQFYRPTKRSIDRKALEFYTRRRPLEKMGMSLTSKEQLLLLKQSKSKNKVLLAKIKNKLVIKKKGE